MVNVKYVENVKYKDENDKYRKVAKDESLVCTNCSKKIEINEEYFSDGILNCHKHCYYE
jgi:hypothetical protein